MKPRLILLTMLGLMPALHAEADTLSSLANASGLDFLRDTIRCPDARTGSCFHLRERVSQQQEKTTAGSIPVDQWQPLGWQVCLTNSLSYDTNPFQDATQSADWHYDAQVDLDHDLNSLLKGSGLEGLVRGSWGTTLMDRYSELSGQFFGVTMELSHKFSGRLEGWEIEFFHDSRWSFDEQLHHMAQAAHSPKLGIQWRRGINDRWETLWHLNGGYLWAHPASQSTAVGNVAVDLHFRDAGVASENAESWLDAKLSAQASYRAYRSGEHDWTAAITLAVERKLNAHCAVSAQVSYTNNNSTLIGGGRDYDQFIVMPALALTATF